MDYFAFALVLPVGVYIFWAWFAAYKAEQRAERKKRGLPPS